MAVIDIEEHSKNGKAVPKDAEGYRIKIDKEHFTVKGLTITGRELLALVKKDPTKSGVYQMIHGKPTRIPADEPVDLTKPGLERFTTLPLDQTEGA